MALKKRLIYKLTLALAPLAYKIITAVLFATCRIHVSGREIKNEFVKQNQPFIAAFWHYGIIYTIFQSNGLPWVCMVSASKDGEYISRILEGLGYRTVRGSKGGGGVGALKGMVKAVREGLNAAIVADGSKGPARKVQSGAILLASITGAPIVPVMWAADKYIVFRSWDRTVLPKPFSRIEFMYGEPIYIPKKMEADALEKYRVEVEKKLNEYYEKMWGLFGIKGH
jgi:hypothetical protein